jgi:hypothetical protein
MRMDKIDRINRSFGLSYPGCAMLVKEKIFKMEIETWKWKLFKGKF